MGAIGHERLAVAGKIELAHEAHFRLGILQVQPATRQLIADHKGETLEPRVMQVLVALYRAGGIVTRDELVEQCWDGRIVTDDAINRVISRIRHIADDIGQGSFQVETITKVGYRLVADNIDVKASQFGQSSDALPQLNRRRLLNVTLATGAMAGLGGFVAWRALEKSEPSREAKALYDRAIAGRGQASLQQTEQTAGFLREAVRLDPNFADAWGALAWTYRALLAYGPRPDASYIKQLSRSAAARALELDPDNADAQAALLMLDYFFGRWAEVEQSFPKFLKRHPGHELVQYNFGLVLNETGRWRDSIPLFHDLANRQPFWPLACTALVKALFNSGRLEESNRLIDDGLQRWPRRTDLWVMRIRSYLVTGRKQEALAYLSDRTKRPVEQTPVVEMETMIVSAMANLGPGRDATAEQVAKVALRDARFAISAMIGVGLLGHNDLVYSMLDGYYFARGPWASLWQQDRVTSFLFFQYLAEFRRDSRFGQLVGEIGLEEFWRASGTQPDYRRFG
jgi:DNA-binding winged helix-turn-helix (wHTH) protein/Tfp pilus assembly protein PilF